MGLAEQRTLRASLFLLSLFLVSAACNTPGTVPVAPIIEIQAPESGSTVAIGETVVISAVATDDAGAGIARVELFVNGESIRSVASPTGPRDVFDAALTWIPTDEGEAEITVIAYREDDAPSQPAQISLSVVGLTLDPTQENTDEPTSQPTQAEVEGSPTAEPIETDQAVITGRVVLDANIRIGPGPYCDVIGGAETNEIIDLLEYSADRRWFKTEVNGRFGWIYASSVAPEGNTSLLPIGTARGCQGCGDGTCNLQETCNTCAQDCGQCCGNGICQSEYGEDCGTCATDCGACCGNGVCEAGRNETCRTCGADCGSCCGNDVCEADLNETCSTCSSDCGSCCGNGLCEASLGETCSTCQKDCGACCGNGLCEANRGESCSTCTSDCGACPDPTEEPTQSP